MIVPLSYIQKHRPHYTENTHLILNAILIFNTFQPLDARCLQNANSTNSEQDHDSDCSTDSNCSPHFERMFDSESLPTLNVHLLLNAKQILNA